MSFWANAASTRGDVPVALEAAAVIVEVSGGWAVVGARDALGELIDGLGEGWTVLSDAPSLGIGVGVGSALGSGPVETLAKAMAVAGSDSAIVGKGTDADGDSVDDGAATTALGSSDDDADCAADEDATTFDDGAATTSELATDSAGALEVEGETVGAVNVELTEAVAELGAILALDAPVAEVVTAAPPKPRSPPSGAPSSRVRQNTCDASDASVRQWEVIRPAGLPVSLSRVMRTHEAYSVVVSMTLRLIAPSTPLAICWPAADAVGEAVDAGSETEVDTLVGSAGVTPASRGARTLTDEPLACGATPELTESVAGSARGVAESFAMADVRSAGAVKAVEMTGGGSSLLSVGNWRRAIRVGFG